MLEFNHATAACVRHAVTLYYYINVSVSQAVFGSACVCVCVCVDAINVAPAVAFSNVG